MFSSCKCCNHNTSNKFCISSHFRTFHVIIIIINIIIIIITTIIIIILVPAVSVLISLFQIVCNYFIINFSILAAMFIKKQLQGHYTYFT